METHEMTHLDTPRLRVALLLLLALLAPLATAHAAPGGGGGGGSSALQLPITGTFTDATNAIGTFTGTLNLQRFAIQNGQVVAVGTLVGTLTDAAGNVLGTVVRNVTLPLLGSATQASCEILHLELGPLDLDLLGLTVHLNRIVLDISAVPGAGNLLGNLLCGIAHLLDGGPLAGLIAQLNQLLQLL
jgi:hypothetical protein